MEKKLVRLPGEAVLGGVAAGMARYFGIDRSIIRVLWVVALLLPIPPTFFWTAILYIILWVALPEAGPGESSYTAYDATGGARPEGESTYTSGTSAAAGGTQPGAFFSSTSDPDRTIKIVGIALLVVGAILLLDELPYWYEIREYAWPVGLIAAGTFLLLRQRDKQQSVESTPSADPFAPADPTPPVAPEAYGASETTSVETTPAEPTTPVVTDPTVDPDAPADPDGETDPDGEPPVIR